MRAIVCENYGSPDTLVYKTLNDPKPSDNEVIVEAEAIGVNFPDGLLVQGKYQVKPPTPFIPGMEVAGKIVEIGKNVQDHTIGERVCAMGTLGGYAEKIAVPANHLIPIPNGMSANDACALLCAYGTSHYALKQRGELKPGETLAVLGAAGSTGIAAIQIGKIMGATVIAVASTKEKQKIAKEAGADHVIGYETLSDDLKALTNGKGVDVLFDPVGGEAFDICSRRMARKGRLLVIGFASGTIPKLPINLVLVKEYSLVGVFWGPFTVQEPNVYRENMIELFQWHQQEKIKPHIEATYPLIDAPKVLNKILNRGAVGKLILTPEGKTQ